jgi:hypothetical protein
MLVIAGQPGKDLCDPHLAVSRRQLLRVGGSSLLGLSLANLLGHRAAQASTESIGGGPGWGRAKSVLMVYLQGGPSHLDLWDPKEDVPDNVRSQFNPISTKIPGTKYTELLPKLADVNDRFTMIRSMSYTPNGLFNHTAAIYQMMTGYTTDKVSPSGQLEPPSPKDFPNFGSNIIRLRPSDEPMLPFVMLPRPLQESNVIGKGGTAGFLGKAYDPYTLYPPGEDMDMSKMDRIRVDDLKLRPEVTADRLSRRARLRDMLSEGMPQLEKAVAEHNLDQYYEQALGLIVSGRARDAFDLGQEPEPLRDAYGRNTFGQSCLLARRLIEAGTRVVEVIWPKVANSDNHSWDMHVELPNRLKNRDCRRSSPTWTTAACSTKRSSLPWANSAAARNAVSAPAATTTAPMAVTTGRTATRPCSPAAVWGVASCTEKAMPRPAHRSTTRCIPASCWRRFTTRSASPPRRSSTTTSTSPASWSKPAPSPHSSRELNFFPPRRANSCLAATRPGAVATESGALPTAVST